MMTNVISEADNYVEIVSREGLPIKFPNRFVGGEGECYFGSSYRKSHAYYPSQAKHDLAAHKLADVVAVNVPQEAKNLPASPHKKMLECASKAINFGEDYYPLVKVLSTIADSFKIDG